MGDNRRPAGGGSGIAGSGQIYKGVCRLVRRQDLSTHGFCDRRIFFFFSVQRGGTGGLSVSGMDCAVYGCVSDSDVSQRTRSPEKLLRFLYVDGVVAASDFYAVLRNQLSQRCFFIK